MSANKKLQGNSELSRLKELWRDSMDESQREYWRSRFLSRDTQAAIRAELKQQLSVTLLYDNQLNAFRDWADDQWKLDLEAERQADDERRLKQEHPDWTKDDLREALLRCAYQRAKASGDFKLGLAAMKQDKSFEELTLDREKFEELKRKAAQADKAKGIMENPELSQQQREARMKHLFGLT